MISIANLNLTVSDGSTIASTEIYGKDKKTYINIGSGNVFTLNWNVPAFDVAGEDVDHYNLVIKRYNTATNLYQDIFDKNVGIPLYTYEEDKETKFINKFYINSSILPVAPLQYKLSIYVVAYGKKGSIITSNIVTTYISKGSGAYVKVKPADYSEALMKRTVTFVNAPTPTDPEPVLVDRDRVPLTAKNADGEVVYLAAEAARVLTSESWNIVQDVYTRNSNSWQDNDIRYEVLLALDEGEQEYKPVKDSNDELIYVL